MRTRHQNRAELIFKNRRMLQAKPNRPKAHEWVVFLRKQIGISRQRFISAEV